MSAHSSNRYRFLLLLGIACSALFLWLALRDVDWQSIQLALARTEKVWAFPFLIALFAFYWLKSARWGTLLSPSIALPTARLFPIVMIGYAGTAVLPMQMGELVRAYIAGRRHNLPYALLLGSIGIERIFDLLTVLALLGFVLLVGDKLPDFSTAAGYLLAAMTAFGFVCAAFFVWRTQASLGLVKALLCWLPDWLRDKILEQLETASRGLMALKEPQKLVSIVCNSVVQWLLMGVCIAISLYAVGIHLPVTGVILVLVATIVGISLPTSPGYIGNIQLAFTLALQPYGVDPSLALAASIFYHLLAYVAVVITGLFFVHRYGYSLAELQTEAQ